MMRFVHSFIVLAIFTFVSACSANHNSVYRSRDLKSNGSTVMLIDAKQRAIIASYREFRTKNGEIEETLAVRRFCSEPSPDVFSVLAQSLGAGAALTKRADPASLELALNLAFSSSETGSTIPRTQTINMLRELMFRTCERFVSGGYDELELSLQAIRDQRLMVSILAIEQLTGAVTPKPVVIGASGTSGAGISGDAIVRLDDARREKVKAESGYKSAVEIYDQANGTDKVCDAIAGKKDEDVAEAQKPKIKICSDAREKRAKALAAQSETIAAYQELSLLAKSGGVTATTTSLSLSEGGLDRADSSSVSTVAKTVETIALRNFDDASEVLMFCLRALREDKRATDQYRFAGLEEMCSKFLSARITLATQLTEADARAAAGLTASTTDENFDQFWTDNASKLATQTGRNAFADAFKKRLITPEKYKADCFRTAGLEDSARACFRALNADQQKSLLIK